MAEDNVETRAGDWPWLKLFQGFWLAFDWKKLLLAAAGILTMALGWWVLAWPFDYGKPLWEDFKSHQADYAPKDASEPQKYELAWQAFRAARRKWNVNFEAVGRPDATAVWEAEDFAEKPEDIEPLKAGGPAVKEKYPLLGKPRSPGTLRTLPWYEDRGPNPYHLVTGQAGKQWEKGQFVGWFVTEQIPVLLEPVIKLFLPVKYLLHPRAGFLTRLYALLALVWMVAVWAVFGGAITRLAVVKVARQEDLDLMDALRYAWRRFMSYFAAPLILLIGAAVLLVLLMFFGLLHWIPGFGEVVDALFWPVLMVVGIFIALILVGLVAWPMMTVTISAEGTEAWEALSRALNFLALAPWRYLFYCFTAIVYGAVLIFFVGFMGSFAVFLTKFGVDRGTLPFQNRDPDFLFVYAPTSWNWRALLMEGAQVERTREVMVGETKSEVKVAAPVVKDGVIDEKNYDDYVNGLRFWNVAGAFMVSLWVWLIFMLVLGFGYSYFWSSSTVITLLMRRHVEDAEMDEVYLEEEDEAPYSGPLSPTPPPSPPSGPTTSLPMVEAPKPADPPKPVAAPVAVTPPPPPPPPSPSPSEPPAPSGNSDAKPPATT